MDNYEYTRPQVDRNARAHIKKLRKKNKSKNIWIVILVLIILFLIGAICFSYARYYKKNYIDPSYQYISMTEEASARAFVWLSKIEDTGLSYEDVKNCMGSFNLEIIKKPAKVKGEYTYEMAEGSYEYCTGQAKAGFEKAYYEAVKRRIIDSGYEGTVTDELVDRLMTDTFGMSVEQYIGECNVSILPEKSEIDEEYILSVLSDGKGEAE